MSSRTDQTPDYPTWARVCIPVAFVAAAAWFLTDDSVPDLGIPPARGVSRADVDPAPPRQAMADPPTTHLGGFDRDCMDCHQIFKGRRYPDQLFQHRDIVVEHGAALRNGCLECHDREDRNRLALHGPETASYADVAKLCGKCHGPVYRDWERGMHGRTHGSWDASSGRQTRLTCTECHDPHRPRYNAFVPLPGPNTRRMGEPTHHDDDPSHLSPLLEHRQRSPKPDRRPHGSP